MRSLPPLGRLSRLGDGLQRPARLAQVRARTAPQWLTGYLQGDGSADALAFGAIEDVDGVDAVWSRIVLAEAPATAGCVAGTKNEGGAGGIQRIVWDPVEPDLEGSVFMAAPGFAWYGPTAAPASGTLLVLSQTIDRDAGMTYLRSAGSGGTTAEASQVLPGAHAYGDDAYLGSLVGASLFDGRIWGDIVYLGHPTQAHLEALLLGREPWRVFAPALVARAWCPAAATEDKGTVTIPDLAPAHGGPFTVRSATMRNGTLANIVVPS